MGPDRAPRRRRVAVAAAALLLAGAAASAAGSPADAADPFAFVVLALAGVIAVAMVGHWLAGRFAQPPVLGELLIGVAAGNLGYWLELPVSMVIMHLAEGRDVFREVWRSGDAVTEVAARVLGPASLAPGGVADRILEITRGADGLALVYTGFALSLFSTLGVLLLTFMVGLQSSITELRRVGLQAARVALLGISAPFILGLLLGPWLLPGAGAPTHLFLAATLCATSVGITARVLLDLDRLHTPEARVILGAALIDDVLGLVLLATIAAMATTGRVAPLEAARVLALSALFIGAVLFYGERVARSAARLFDYMDRQQGKLLFPIALAFALAWLASAMHLAAIVGAFAAGLIVSDSYFHHAEQRWKIEDLVEPLESIFAPVFFVLMGMQVNLPLLAESSTLLLALSFTAAAVTGKLVAGTVAGRGVDGLSVGIGMVPRGEVGLIFASLGRGLGVLSDEVFSAIVVMVILTTFATPLALRWSTSRRGAARGQT